MINDQRSPETKAKLRKFYLGPNLNLYVFQCEAAFVKRACVSLWMSSLNTTSPVTLSQSLPRVGCRCEPEVRSQPCMHLRLFQPVRRITKEIIFFFFFTQWIGVVEYCIGCFRRELFICRLYVIISWKCSEVRVSIRDREKFKQKVNCKKMVSRKFSNTIYYTYLIDIVSINTVVETAV